MAAKCNKCNNKKEKLNRFLACFLENSISAGTGTGLWYRTGRVAVLLYMLVYAIGFYFNKLLPAPLSAPSKTGGWQHVCWTHLTLPTAVDFVLVLGGEGTLGIRVGGMVARMLHLFDATRLTALQIIHCGKKNNNKIGIDKLYKNLQILHFNL